MSAIPSQKRYKLTDTVDFLVIGCGASGAVLARELAHNGFSVVVLEQGPWLTASDFTHDEYRHWTQSLLTNDYRKQPTTFRKTPQDKAVKQPHSLHRQFLALSRDRFHRGKQEGHDHRHWLHRLADNLRRPRTLLHQSRVRAGRLRPGGREPLRSTALQAVSTAAHAGEVQRSPL
jgi:choline dehydrogenase-like flavoprotein